MFRTFFAVIVLVCAVSAAPGAEDTITKFTSPDGRFALQITKSTSDEYTPRTVALVEKSSAKIVVPLGDAYYNHMTDTVLIWSKDSKWFAYATRGDKEGDTSVYVSNGSAFEEVPLPTDTPEPKIKYGKGAGEGFKNYGGAMKPLRWLKSGDLELSNDLMMLSRTNGKSYTGTVVFTLSFDAQHHATVHQVQKTKTTVDE